MQGFKYIWTWQPITALYLFGVECFGRLTRGRKRAAGWFHLLYLDLHLALNELSDMPAF